MSTANTIEVKCRDCDTMITKPVSGYGQRKSLCDPCKYAAQRKNYRVYHAKVRAAEKVAQPRRTCKGCDTDISHLHGKAIRCEPCRKEVAREYQRQLRTANPKPSRKFFCEICNAEIERVGNSGRPRFCPTHAEEALRASQARSEAKRAEARGAVWYTHCFYCKSELPEPRQPARTPARCDACKRQKLYAWKRAQTDAAGSPIAPCRDCGESVPVKRKGPRAIRCVPCVKKRQRAQWIKYAEIYRHMRRAWKYAAGYEKFSPREIYERDGWRCGVCRKKISKKLRHPNPMSVSLDHKISLSRGGPHSRANTQPAHLKCNIRKNKYDALPGEQMPLPIVFS